MLNKWIIRNATIVTSSGEFIGDVAVENSFISQIGSGISGCFKKEIDAQGKRLLPGLIDPHVHFELPVGGRVSSDDFYSGTKAAVQGGITTVIDFTTPFPGMSLCESLNERIECLKKSVIDVALHVTVCGWSKKKEAEIDACIHRGATSFKFFTAYEESGRRTSYEDLFEAASTISKHDGVMLIHAEDQSALISADRLKSDSFSMYESSRPPKAEELAINRMAVIQKETGTRVYIVHLSSEIGLTSAGRSELLLETCPHYLILDSSKYLENEGYRYGVAPPLRDKQNQKALWNALSHGKIHTIGTDHCYFDVRIKDDAGDHFT
ncbi:amidohydrolase family protein, partial [bacterium]|nr:amidohydrolase family protein [candidate division CSSED10-310 bacterium]